MHTLIITGGDFDEVFAASYIKEKQFQAIIAADRGLLRAKNLNLEPDYILGDFDSCDASVMDEYKTREKELYPSEKDDTDTGLALQKAVEIGSKRITILGATGTRIDHLLGNIGQLLYGKRNGVEVELVDPNNRVTVLSKKTRLRKKDQFGTYISLIPVGTVTGVTLSGFKYPLQEDTLQFYETWGISNELLADVGEISYQEGQLLMIESKD